MFDASREGRAGEIAAWSNALGALVSGALVTTLLWPRFSVQSAWIGLGSAIVIFAALRLALAHRITVWIAAAIGTLSVSAAGGGVAWLFAHLLESVAAPSIAAVLGALVAALAPAWSYSRIARRRANDIPDSLVEPRLSSPSSPPSG